MPINDDFKYQVKMANPLDSVVSSYVSLKRSGRNFMACCPFHSEKTPSFHVNVEEGFYKCFGCGESGDVFSFIMKIENLTFMEALKLLAERANIPMPSWNKRSYNDKNSEERNTIFNINREAGHYFCAQLKKSPNAISYLNDRKLQPQIYWNTYGMGYAPDDWWSLINYLREKGFNDDDIIKSGLARKNDKGLMFSFFKNRIIVPILDVRGNVIAFGGRILTDAKNQPKYLNSPDTPVFKKSENLFSLHLAKKNIPQDKTLLLAEGYMDVIALYQAGFKNSVATLGTSLTPEQVNIIKRYADNVIICYDNDTAGITATNRAIGLFLNSPNTKDINIKVLQMQGAKDPDEYIKHFGSDKFRLLLEQSVDGIDFQISQVRNSLNLYTNIGKVNMLRQSAEILAQIKNETSREVYVSSIARECNIEPSVFSKSIQQISSNNSKYGYINNNNYHYGNTNYHQVTPENHQYYAEEQIIGCLSNTHDFELIQYAINSSVTEYLKVYKNIFIAICNHAEKICEKNDISIIHDDLSEEDYKKLIDIKQRYHQIIDYNNAKSTLEQCIYEIFSINRMEKINNNKNEKDYLNQLQLEMRNKHHIK